MGSCPGGDTVLVKSCPSCELYWWGVVLVGGIVLVGSCPNGDSGGPGIQLS